MIELTAPEFIKYMTRYGIVPKGDAEKYTEENPKERYCYEDINAAYQSFVDYLTTRREVGSGSTNGKFRYNEGGGCSRTISGNRYGWTYD